MRAIGNYAQVGWLGADPAGPRVERVTVRVSLRPHLDGVDWSGVLQATALFSNPSMVPITRDQLGGIAAHIRNILKVQVIGTPEMRAVMPPGWKAGDLLNYSLVMVLEVPEGTDLDWLAKELDRVVNWTFKERLLRALNLVLETVRGGAQAVVHHTSSLIAASFWDVVKPLALPLALVAGGYLVFKARGQIANRVQRRFA